MTFHKSKSEGNKSLDPMTTAVAIAIAKALEGFILPGDKFIIEHGEFTMGYERKMKCSLNVELVEGKS